uniref:Rac GTPase-activating protein 1 n=1 Tax=Anas platyrhynchos TaxID=8839 RepID=A0A8B9SJJ9_ANAPL
RGARMLRQRCGRLLAQLERALQLLELDYIRIARCFEATRQKCRRLEQDGRRAREQLARAEAERAALEVKLKHARNQVEVEMKKRHRAEAELEKQALRRCPRCWLGSGGAPAVLSPSSSCRSSAVDDSCQSLLSHSDISYDRTEDDVVRNDPTPCPVVAEHKYGGAACPTWPSQPPDSGGRAPGQDSHTEGSSGGQPAPAPFTSPPPSLLQPQHQFTSKTVRASSPPLTPGHAGGMQGGADEIPPCQVIRPEPCGACGSRLRFGKAALKCRRCQLLLHTKCRPCCPGPCGPRARQHAWPREGVLADFAPPTPPLVPALVVHCVTEVETRGLAEAGLYRVPGAEPLVREWKQRLLRAGGALPSLGDVSDIHVVCGVLKDFLRGLKEPLVTFSLHPAFLRAADIPDETACSTALRHVVGKLPPANRDTLAFLMLHLLRVSRSPDCKMDILNLSRVFGPTLVGHSSATPTPLAIMEDTPRQSKVVARLLALPPDFWRGFVGTGAGEPGADACHRVGVRHPNPKSAFCPTEPLCHPVTSPEPHGGQLSPPGTCCLPGALRSCVGTAPRPP